MRYLFLQLTSDILLVDEGDDVTITKEVLFADSLLHHRFLFQVNFLYFSQYCPLNTNYQRRQNFHCVVTIMLDETFDKYFIKCREVWKSYQYWCCKILLFNSSCVFFHFLRLLLLLSMGHWYFSVNLITSWMLHHSPTMILKTKI